ncbi:AAA family ATPase [Myxococcota bacterium]|nr:AAA family ATPase [Myxococcota bacterium]MCZ7617437.1 AAA family ATPase [Myxococcota bacterium]
MTFRFGRYELNEDAGELRRDGALVEIQPKPLALLALLLRERERVVPLDELFDALWPGIAVTPSSLTRAVSMARRAIGDTHRGELLKSVARRGYRFAGTVIESEAPRPIAAPGRAGRRADGVPDGVPDGRAGDLFVGREDALTRLRTAWAAALGGRGGIALVGGPPGIGKTRLAETFAEDVGRTGGLVLMGRSHEGEGVPAFWLWTQVLRRLALHEAGAEALRELAGVPTELRLLVSGGTEEEAGDAAAGSGRSDGAPEHGRFLLFDAVARALAQASRRRPLLLVLDDLQWADSPSLRLLEHLGFESGDQAILVIATVREDPSAPAAPIGRTLPRLRRTPRCEDITLRGFSRREVAMLLEHAIGRPPPPDLSSELFARTEGVPLFVREAIRRLAERGELRHPERVRRWDFALPARALDLIRRPLERLSPACEELVAVAALLGRDFHGPLAAAVIGMHRELALDLLDDGVRAGVLEPGDVAGSWRFTHALFQELARERLPAGVRARLHLRVAAELERRHRDDPDRIIAELAHHHHAALAVGDPERAFACAERAATRAARLLAHEQAAMHWEQARTALDHCHSVDPARRLAVLLALGEEYRLAGDRARRRSVFGEAIEAARALGRPREHAQAAIGFCDLSEWAPNDDEARARLETALAGLPAKAGIERTRILTRIAYLSARDPNAAPEPVARQAVALARELGDAEALQDALYTLFFLLAGPDHLDERRRLAHEAEAIARKGGSADPTVITLLDLACDRIVAGDADGAGRARSAAAEIAGPGAHPGRIWHLCVYDAGDALRTGCFDAAAHQIDEVVRLGFRIEHPYAAGVERALRALLARELGDIETLLRIFDPTRPIRMGPVQYVQAIVGRALWAVGRAAEARAVYEDLLGAGVDAIGRNIRWYGVIVEASLLCAELGDAGRAGALLAHIEPLAHQHAMLPLALYGGPLARCAARLHETLGRFDEAKAHFEAAREAADAVGALPTRARVQLEHGRLLARRGARAPASEQLAEAARTAGRLGMLAVAREAQEALDKL